MKQKNKPREIRKRKVKIIEFVKNHPFCSRDNIFTKGKIPKSKLTADLIQRLVSDVEIKCVGRKRQAYYIPKSGLLKHLEFLRREIKDIAEEENTSNNKILPLLLADFLKTRLKVIKAEEKRIEKYGEASFEQNSWQLPMIKNPFKIIPLNDALERLEETILYHENPSKFAEMLLPISLVSRINDDEFYLRHQLHSHPKEKHYPFKKLKISGARRDTSYLIENVKKWKNEFGLSQRNYKNNIIKLGVYPGGWFQRQSSETSRTLYSNKNRFNITRVPHAVLKRDTSVYEYIVKPMAKVMDRVGLQRDNYESFMKKKPKKISNLIIKELKLLLQEYEIEFYLTGKEILTQTH